MGVLVPCPLCGRDISSEAASCPWDGEPRAGERGLALQRERLERAAVAARERAEAEARERVERAQREAERALREDERRAQDELEDAKNRRRAIPVMLLVTALIVPAAAVAYRIHPPPAPTELWGSLAILEVISLFAVGYVAEKSDVRVWTWFALLYSTAVAVGGLLIIFTSSKWDGH